MSLVRSLAAIPLLLVLATVVHAQSEDVQIPDAEGWVVVIDDRGAADANPFAMDPRTDIRTLAVRDEGRYLGIRLQTAASPNASFAGDIRSSVSMGMYYSWGGGETDYLSILAGPEGFRAELGNRADETWPYPNDLILDAGSTPWNFTLHVDRSGLEPDGQYTAADGVNWFYARSRGEVNASQWLLFGDSLSQTHWGEPVWLQGQGGFAIDDAYLLNPESASNWYTYRHQGRIDGVGVAVDGDDIWLAYYHTEAESSNRLAPEKPLGLYVARLEDGHLNATWVAPVNATGPYGVSSPPLIAVADGIVSVAYWSNHNSIPGAMDTLSLATGKDGRWSLEQLPVPVSGQGRLDDLVAHGHKLALAYDGHTGPSVAERIEGRWTLMLMPEEIAAARIAYADDSQLHVVAAINGEMEERVDHFDGQWQTLWRAELGWNVRLNGLAMDLRDNVPCWMAWLRDDEDALLWHCGGEDVQQLPLQDWLRYGPLDVSFAPDGIAMVLASRGTDGAFGIRSVDGYWWWEHVESHGGGVGALPDGRFLQWHDRSGAFDLAVSMAGLHSDETRPFWTGYGETWQPEQTSPEVSQETEAEPDLVPPNLAADAPVPDEEGVPAPGVFLGLVLAGVAWMRRSRVPQP